MTWASLLLTAFLAVAPLVALAEVSKGTHSQPVPEWLEQLPSCFGFVGFFGAPFVGIASLVIAFVNTFRKAARWWTKVVLWLLTIASFASSYMELRFIAAHIGR